MVKRILGLGNSIEFHYNKRIRVQFDWKEADFIF